MDPWLWNIDETVAKLLKDDTSLWDTGDALPPHLETLFRVHNLNGFTLLRDVDHDFLLNGLGIKSILVRDIMVKAAMKLRSQSQGYSDYVNSRAQSKTSPFQSVAAAETITTELPFRMSQQSVTEAENDELSPNSLAKRKFAQVDTSPTRKKKPRRIQPNIVSQPSANITTAKASSSAAGHFYEGIGLDADARSDASDFSKAQREAALAVNGHGLLALNEDDLRLLAAHPPDEDSDEVIDGDVSDTSEDPEFIEDQDKGAPNQPHARAVQYLSSIEVQKAIVDAIESLERKWSRSELPKLQAKAHSIWDQGHSLEGFKNVNGTTSRLKHLETRLDQQCQHVRLNKDWKTVQSISSLFQAMEVTIFDRKECQWRLELWKGERPQPVARGGASNRGRARVYLQQQSHVSRTPTVRGRSRGSRARRSRYSAQDLARETFDPSWSYTHPLGTFEPWFLSDNQQPNTGNVTTRRIPSSPASVDSVLGDVNSTAQAPKKGGTPEDAIDLTNSSRESSPVEEPNTSKVETSNRPRVFTPEGYAKLTGPVTEAQVDSWDLEVLDKAFDRQRIVLKLLLSLKRSLPQVYKALKWHFNDFEKPNLRYRMNSDLDLMNKKETVHHSHSFSRNDKEALKVAAATRMNRLVFCWIERTSMYVSIKDKMPVPQQVKNRAQSFVNDNFDEFYNFIHDAIRFWDDQAKASMALS